MLSQDKCTCIKESFYFYYCDIHGWKCTWPKPTLKNWLTTTEKNQILKDKGEK